MSFFLVGCSIATKDEATTSLFSLLDVTSGRGRNSESYWLDTSTNLIYQCFHDGSSTKMGPPKSCSLFHSPIDIDPMSTLITINVGSGQVSQSIWNDPTDRMYICVHDKEMWNGHTKDSAKCTSYVKPLLLQPGATLSSINSGSNAQAQSFWINPDGSVAICTHQKLSEWLLGPDSLGDAKTCNSFPLPTIFPPDSIDPQLRGVTSDSGRAWESFWQDKNGVVIWCTHENPYDLFEGSRFGEAKECDYWWAPKSEDLFRN